MSIFPTTTIATEAGTITVPCEPINEWLAITPEIGTNDNGDDVLAGTWTITHRPTGTTLCDGGGCIECCRATGRMFAEMATADWSALTADTVGDWCAALSEDDRWRFGIYRQLGSLCDAEACEIPAEVAA